jgi:hypothetical protein
MVSICSVLLEHVWWLILQSGDPSDWLVLAMHENAQLSDSTGIAAHGITAHFVVRSSLWASQFQKLPVHSLPDASSFVPGGFSHE